MRWTAMRKFELINAVRRGMASKAPSAIRFSIKGGSGDEG